MPCLSLIHIYSYGDDRKTRHIETRPQISHYTVETSVNGADSVSYTHLDVYKRQL